MTWQDSPWVTIYNSSGKDVCRKKIKSQVNRILEKLKSKADFCSWFFKLSFVTLTFRCKESSWAQVVHLRLCPELLKHPQPLPSPRNRQMRREEQKLLYDTEFSGLFLLPQRSHEEIPNASKLKSWNLKLCDIPRRPDSFLIVLRKHF